MLLIGAVAIVLGILLALLYVAPVADLLGQTGPTAVGFGVAVLDGMEGWGLAHM